MVPAIKMAAVVQAAVPEVCVLGRGSLSRRDLPTQLLLALVLVPVLAGTLQHSQPLLPLVAAVQAPMAALAVVVLVVALLAERVTPLLFSQAKVVMAVLAVLVLPQIMLVVEAVAVAHLLLALAGLLQSVETVVMAQRLLFLAVLLLMLAVAEEGGILEPMARVARVAVETPEQQEPLILVVVRVVALDAQAVINPAQQAALASSS